MSSERRIRASRANGAKSRGLKTPESKARSSKNSLRLGLLARTVVLEDENLQSFTDLLIAVARDLDLQNEIERALAENMAISRWRLQRLLALERATLKIEMDKHDPAAQDPATRAALAFRALSDESHSLDLLNRYEARIDRQFARSLNLLLKLRQDAKPAERSKNNFCQTNLVPNPDTDIPPPNVGQVGRCALWRPVADSQSPARTRKCRKTARQPARPAHRAPHPQLPRAPLNAPLPSIFHTRRRSKIPGA